MFKNSLKLAWRNLVKDRQFTSLNLVGLSTGLACALLIYLWIHDELSVDKFNRKDDRLYSVLKTFPNSDGTIGMYGVTQGLLAKSMAADLPEVENAVAVRQEPTGIISVAGKNIKAKPDFVEQDFFNVFSYRIIEGSPNTIWSDKNGVVLSDKLALKLFNTTKGIIGKRIEWDDNNEFKGSYNVAGVFEAPPSNATDQFDFLFGMKLYADKEGGQMGDLSFWGSNMMNTYVVLKKGVNKEEFKRKIKDYTKTKIKSLYPADHEMEKYEGDLFIQRYSDKYLYNHYENGVQSGGRIEYVKLFSIIAVFLLVIACINFMNLATAKAAKRAKEVGIKKVSGASRRILILQYMGESFLMVFLSLAIAILLVAMLLPAFKQITGKEIGLQYGPGFIFSVIGITLFTGLVAGSYPALYLSAFKPVQILKGKINTSSGESWIRKGLVVFQFTISVVLIVSVIVVYQQMKLIQTTNLGYNKDNIIRFANKGKMKENFSGFLSDIKNIPGVVNASAEDGDFLGNAGHSGGGISWEGKDPALGIEYYGVGVDYDFFETMGLKMAEGRPFSKKFGSDSSNVIFNESAIAAMHLKNPVGKIVSLWGKKKEIIGIVKDYHFESLYKKISPAFLTCSQDNNTVLVKIRAGAESQTIPQIERLYKVYNSGLTFDYKFLDDDYQALYSSEQRVAVLSRYFAGIAIIISCLGLFGLAAFTAQRRRKEIGIRKVVGASVSNIAAMLSADFLKLVLISLVIAIPLSWWAANMWLESFAYRINLNPGVFFIAGLAIVIITLITISFQAVKAAIANPVKSLRTE